MSFEIENNRYKNNNKNYLILNWRNENKLKYKIIYNKIKNNKNK